MDFRDPPVIAGEEPVEDLGQPDPRLPLDPAHDPEVDRRKPPVGQREEIALVEIGMKEAVDHRLPQEGADQDRRQSLQIVPRLDQCLAVGVLDAVDPLERHHPARSAGPVDRRHVEAAFGDEILAKLGRRRRLAPQVQFPRGPLPEMSDDRPGPEPRRLAAHPLDLRRRPFVGLERPGEILLDIRPEHLDRDEVALGGDRAVDLCDRGGADRLLVDMGEDFLQGLLQPQLDRLAHFLERSGGEIVLERRQVARRLGTDQIGPRRERLSELDRRRPEFLERLAISRHFGNPRPEAGDPRQPADRGRRVGVALDPAQRAVAGEHPAPFEEPPDMDDRPGQIRPSSRCG